MPHDFVSDLHPSFEKVAASVFPDINVEETRNSVKADSLHGNAFADPYNKLHPIHTKNAVALSALYVQTSNVPVGNVTQTRLKTACAAYGITEDSLKSPLVKAAAAVPALEAYALTVKTASDEAHYTQSPARLLWSIPPSS